MLKFVSKGDISQTGTEAVLICEMADFTPPQQGLLPASVWKEWQELQVNPKWVPGAMKVMKDAKGKPSRVAFKSNLLVIFANVRDEEKKISYKTIRTVLRKLKDTYERLELKSIATVMPGVQAGQSAEILPNVIRSLFQNLFEEKNPGHGLYVEVYE